MIKAVMFDFAGVYFTRDTKALYHHLKKEYGTSLSLAKKVFNSKKPIGNSYRCGKINTREFWSIAKKEFKLPWEDIQKIKKKWRTYYKPINGTVRLVKKVGKNYPVYAFSGNILERTRYAEKKYHFRKNFDGCFFSYNLGYNKWSINFFRQAFKSLRFKPSECVLLDDNKVFIANARKSGMKTILFKNPKQAARQLKKFGVKL